MVPLHILVPREMKETLDGMAESDQRTLAITVRNMLKEKIAERLAAEKTGGR